MKTKAILMLCALLFLVACTVPVEKQCVTADDCVAATCCHASDAVNAEFGPECSEALCTAECAPRTLDCGAGSIDCVRGSCRVVLN
tara:strand:+ start:3870 stop:4127 length:258 start_codon:yes stop_codon:yes gene_type:complete